MFAPCSLPTAWIGRERRSAAQSWGCQQYASSGEAVCVWGWNLWCSCAGNTGVEIVESETTAGLGCKGNLTKEIALSLSLTFFLSLSLSLFCSLDYCDYSLLFLWVLPFYFAEGKECGMQKLVRYKKLCLFFERWG